MSATCGNLGDGKPCEWLKTPDCPLERACVSPFPDGYWSQEADTACDPVLALLEARKEAAKWKRAAEALSVTCGAMQVGCPGGDYCGKQASPELCAPCYLKQALDGTVNRGPTMPDLDLEFTHVQRCPTCGRDVAAGTEHRCQPSLLAYEITFAGITAVYCARTRARARFLAALQIVDAGYAPNEGEALRAMRCIRAPWDDVRALSRGREGCVPYLPTPATMDVDF